MFSGLYLSNKGFDGDRYGLFEIVRKARFCNLRVYIHFSNMFCLHSPIQASLNLNMVKLMNNIIYTVLVQAENA